MNLETINTQLYIKMRKEQDCFKTKLLSMTANEVLEHAYEFICQEDILLSFEYNDLSAQQAAALLKSPTPLADIFKKWDGWKNSQYMINIWNTVEAYADEMVRETFVESQRDAR